MFATPHSVTSVSLSSTLLSPCITYSLGFLHPSNPNSLGMVSPQGHCILHPLPQNLSIWNRIHFTSVFTDLMFFSTQSLKRDMSQSTYCFWNTIKEISGMLLLLLLLLLLSHFSRVQLCATPETAANQGPTSLGFSRQEHWSGLPFPPPMHESEEWKWSPSVVSDS